MLPSEAEAVIVRFFSEIGAEFMGLGVGALLLSRIVLPWPQAIVYTVIALLGMWWTYERGVDIGAQWRREKENR